MRTGPSWQAPRRGGDPLPLLLQLADSALPTGGFAHSNGLESLVRDGFIASAEDLEGFVVAHVALVVRTGDLAFLRVGFRATVLGDARALRRAAAEDVAARPAVGQRDASLALGRSLLRATRALAATPAEASASLWLAEVLGETTPRATTFGGGAAALGVDEAGAQTTFAYVAAAGIAAAGVRLGVASPLEAQRAARRAMFAAAAPPVDEAGFFAPLADIAAMRHENLDARVFRS